MSNRIKKRLSLLARGSGEVRVVGVFSLLEDKIIWTIKENKHKIMLRKFNCAVDKIEGMVETKYKDFIDVVPIMHWQNSSWIMGLRIYEEGRTQISLNSPTTIDPLAQITE